MSLVVSSHVSAGIQTMTCVSSDGFRTADSDVLWCSPSTNQSCSLSLFRWKCFMTLKLCVLMICDIMWFGVITRQIDVFLFYHLKNSTVCESCVFVCHWTCVLYECKSYQWLVWPLKASSGIFTNFNQQLPMFRLIVIWCWFPLES